MSALERRTARPRIVTALVALNAAQALLAVAMATQLARIAAEQTGGARLSAEMWLLFFGLPAALSLLGASNAAVALGLFRMWRAAWRWQLLISLAWLPAIPYGSLAGIVSFACAKTPGVKLLFSRRGALSREQEAIVAALDDPRGLPRFLYVAAVALALLGVVYAINLFAGAVSGPRAGGST